MEGVERAFTITYQEDLLYEENVVACSEKEAFLKFMNRLEAGDIAPIEAETGELTIEDTMGTQHRVI